MPDRENAIIVNWEVCINTTNLSVAVELLHAISYQHLCPVSIE